jgi:hypothetical protein
LTLQVRSQFACAATAAPLLYWHGDKLFKFVGEVLAAKLATNATGLAGWPVVNSVLQMCFVLAHVQLLYLGG